MEELVDIVSFTKELAELATFQRTEIQNAIFSPSFKKPVYQTGTLFREIGDYNTVSRMLRMENNSATIAINAAPPKTFYGIFAITGTSTHKKYGIRNYPAIGLEETEKKIKEIQDEIGEAAFESVKNQVNTIFSALPKKV